MSKGFINIGSNWLKNDRTLIKIFFKLFEVAAPFILLVTCLVPSSIPLFVAITAAIFVGILIAVSAIKPEWTRIALKLAVYLQVPLIIYQGEVNPANWVNLQLLRSYNVIFVMVAFVAVMVLKLTRRKSGFKSSPMDFLILFIALVIPNIPDAHIRSYDMGLIAAKIITLYYGYEVLIGELRRDYRRLTHATIITLLLLCGRSFIGV